VAFGCGGGGGDIEQEPDPSQAEAYNKLIGIEAGVSLDPEGKIIAVDLDNASHGDDKLSLLKDIPTLTGVNLSGSSVTDAGLQELFALQSLKTVNLEDTKITLAGANALKEALPDCRILWGDFDPSEGSED
jgi:hypothetical protein